MGEFMQHFLRESEVQVHSDPVRVLTRSSKNGLTISRIIPSRELTYPPKNGIFEDDFPFPQVGYVNVLEGIHWRLVKDQKYTQIDILPIQVSVHVRADTISASAIKQSRGCCMGLKMTFGVF